MNSKLSIFGFLVILGLFITTTSCKKDNGVNCGGLGWAFAIVDESTALSEASAAWSADPDNKAKCEAYLAAYEDYLKALRSYDECVTGADRNEWQDSIDEALQEIDNTDCE